MLGWLLNLGFAGGSGSAIPAVGDNYPHRQAPDDFAVFQRQPVSEPLYQRQADATPSSPRRVD